MPETKDLYIDVMKKSLSFTLWPEPPQPMEFTYHFFRLPAFLRSPLSALLRGLGRFHLQLGVSRKDAEERRKEGAIWPGYAHTMIGLKRMDNLQYCVETALREGIPGDLIETGVWRGGACIFMRALLAAHGETRRRVFLADSFQGLPKPDGKYAADRGDIHHTFSPYLAVSQEEVEGNFRKFGLLDSQVVFLKGWFKDTLPQAPIERLSVLRLDGDMYGSTIEVLESLYPKLSKGGFCIIDDYGLEGCQRAVDDYRAKNGITAPLQEVDWSGRWWRKE
jgi:O-methyltransferase